MESYSKSNNNPFEFYYMHADKKDRSFMLILDKRGPNIEHLLITL